MFIYASIACRKSPPQGHNHSFLWWGDCVGLTLEGGGLALVLNPADIHLTLRLISWYVCAEIFKYSHLFLLLKAQTKVLKVQTKRSLDFNQSNEFGELSTIAAKASDPIETKARFELNVY